MIQGEKLPLSPFLYPILDSGFSSDLVRDARDLIRAGVALFQIRAKNLSKARVFQIAEELAEDCRSQNVRMILNDLVDVVLVSGAMGVHLGQDDFPVNEARKLLPDGIIGISTHNLQQFQTAISLPVDYIAAGPIYETSTKPGAHPSLGPAWIRKVRKLTETRVVCIGGIRAENFAELVESGADGLALISELYSGPSLYDTICRLLDTIRSAGRNT